MDAGQSAREWAREEFGHAQLGNVLRTRRLVSMVARLADAPAGLVTSVFTTVGERVGAYRFLENDHISLSAIVASCAQAAIRRAKGAPWVFVPVDGSSLSLADPSGRRQLGAVGTYEHSGRGLKTMASIAVHPDGTPLGLVDLQCWVREEAPGRKATREQRTVEEKETRFWLRAIQRANAMFTQAATGTQAWFQLDREGDFHDLLTCMTNLRSGRVTVRAAQNRRTATAESKRLWDVLRAQPAGGRYGLTVLPGKNRQARCAQMVVRWALVNLVLRDRRVRRYGLAPVTVWAVLALEEGTVPPGEKPLQWLLLTNAPVTGFHDAIEVLFGYSQRWRIEIVQSQLTKPAMRPVRRGGDDVADLHLAISHDYAIDEELNQRSALLERRLGQASAHLATEPLDAVGQGGHLKMLLGRRFELALLGS